MDIHNCAKAEGQLELAGDAFDKAREIYSDIEDEDVNSDCSRSSCSECEPPQSSPEPPESPPPAEDYVNVKRSSTNRHVDYPPLPVFNYARPKKSWAQEINNAPYVPPLPFAAASNRSSEPIRVNLPKLELKVSAYSKKHPDRSNQSARHRIHSTANYSAAATLTSDNVLLVDPPLPTLIRKTSSQDNLISIDVVSHHPTHRLYHNSFSTENLNHIVSGSGYPNLDKIPRALPRIHMNPSNMPVHQQKHMVIEVVPKPSTHIKPIVVPAAWKVPDQTLGIPLTTPIPPHMNIHNNNYHHSTQYVHRPPAFAISSDLSAISSHFAIKQPQSLLNIPTVIHQHPITQANIPASSSTSASGPTYILRPPHKEPPTRRPQQPSTTTSTMNSILSQAQPSPRQREPNAEKNKVKFSDTVTVALVPEITRKDKPIPLGATGKRNSGFPLTDPQRELADSLPLCHPNDDYLKDFTPISSATDDEVGASVVGNGSNGHQDRNGNNQHNTSSNSKLGSTGGGAIKVVHFGVI